MPDIKDTFGLDIEGIIANSDCPLNKTIFPDRFLKKGNYLQDPTPREDPDAGEEVYVYRKVLSNYDKEKKSVLLSQEGSRLHPELLEQPDREFTSAELFSPPMGDYIVRAKDWDISKPVDKE
ncbi:hypothetical protein KY331_00850 [Candidatus Woesearchaeota archaeon]|nr:hypothetical protein [Candidatus Woesearchaeota archaeon]